MHRGRSFLILVVLALGLGAYIYFVESRRDTSDPALNKDKLFAVEADAVEELRVRAADGSTTALKKEGGTWRIVEPAAIDADESTVSSLVSTLTSADIQRALEPAPANLADFGLEPPRYSVGFRAAGDAAMKTLRIGNKTPTGADLYARVEGEPRVVLVSAYLDDSLNRTTFDLRDKTVLKFQRDAVDSVTMSVVKSPTVTLAKSADQWRLTSPVEARADFGAIDGLIGRVDLARMKSIVAPAEPSPADLKKYGLDAPQGRIVLGAGSTRATLELGAKEGETSVYARDLSRPMVFTVDSSLLDDLKKSPADLRIKDVFAFRSYSATHVELTFGGATYAFAKEKAPASADPNAAAPPDVWKQTKPAAKDVDQTKFTDLLTALSNLRAESFVDKPAAGADELGVVAHSGEGASHAEDRVTFRRAGTAVEAVRAGEAGAAVVPTTEFDRAMGLLREIVK
jgi:hypothetical protein